MLATRIPSVVADLFRHLQTEHPGLEQIIQSTTPGQSSTTAKIDAPLVASPSENLLAGAWTPPDLEHYTDNLVLLNNNEVKDIENAVVRFKGNEEPPQRHLSHI